MNRSEASKEAIRRLAAAVALVLSLSIWQLPIRSRAQSANELPALSKAQWREDLQHFARELSRKHKNAFHHISRQQFERSVAELDAAIPSLADHQIVVRMLQMTASIGDAHTSIRLPKTFKLYPVIPN